MTLKARIVPLATCTPATKNEGDSFTLSAIVKNTGTVTIPAGLYREIFCNVMGGITISCTSGSPLAPGGTISCGATYTLYSGTAGTYYATATVWKDSTKAKQLDTYTCPNLLKVNPIAVVGGGITNFIYSFDGVEWHDWVGTINVKTNELLRFAVGWGKNPESPDFCGNINLLVTKPDKTTINLWARENQDKCTRAGTPGWYVLFGPIGVEQEGNWKFSAKLTETGKPGVVLDTDFRMAEMVPPVEPGPITGVSYNVSQGRCNPGVLFSWAIEQKRDAFVTKNGESQMRYPTDTVNYDSYAIENEMIATLIKLYNFGSNYNTKVNFRWYRLKDNIKVFEYYYVIPSAQSQGYDYWTWYGVLSWIGKCLGEINGRGTYRCKIDVSGGPISGATNVYFNVI